MVELLSPLAWRYLLLALAPLLGCSLYSPYQQQRLVEWAESDGGRVVYDHQARNLKEVDCWYTAGSEADEKQWQSRLPEDTWLAKKLGPHYAYRVESVSFYESKLKGDVSRLAGSKGLKELIFCECELTAEMFAAIGKCRDLETLHVTDCQIESEAWLAHLTKLPKLKDLSFNRVSLPAGSLAHLGKCRGLEQLELTFCDFDPAQIQQLQGLTRLRHCNLGFTPVGDEELGVLRHWPNLIGLGLGSKVTDAGLVEVGKVQTLERLALMKSPATDAGMEHVIRLPKLKNLQISDCKVSDEMWARLAREHPGLDGGYVR